MTHGRVRWQPNLFTTEDTGGTGGRVRAQEIGAMPFSAEKLHGHERVSCFGFAEIGKGSTSVVPQHPSKCRGFSRCG